MSNLVPYKPNKIEVASADFGAPDSALRGVKAGQLSASDLDPSYFADEDEATDLHGIRNQVPRLTANSKHKVFCPPNTDEAGTHPAVIEGVILARNEGNVLYVPNKAMGAKRLVLANKLGYQQLLDTKQSWICSNGNLVDPARAQLNPALSQEQRDAAIRLGIGGATKRGCAGCPCATWHKIDDGTKDGANVRLCQSSESLVWLDSQQPEPVVLQVGAATSVKVIKDFFARTFKRLGKPLSLFTYVLRLSFDTVTTEDGIKVGVLHPEVAYSLNPAEMANLREARKAVLPMLERVEMAEQIHEPEPEAVPEPSAAVLDQAAEDALAGMM
jgi:hypothetical protein